MYVTKDCMHDNYYYYNYSGFTMIPTNLTVVEGVEAVFHCQHPTADAIGWRLNGTTFFDSSWDDVFVAITSIAGGIVNTLTILALSHYNKTQVECMALYFDGYPNMVSITGNLIVQGLLINTSLDNVNIISYLIILIQIRELGCCE